MDQSKRNFIEREFIILLKDLKADAKGDWGVLNGQQMVEHMSDAFRNASGKLKLPLVTPADKLPKMRAFVMSETPFKENTKNALMSETPRAMVNPDMKTAIAELKGEIEYFFSHYEKNPSFTFMNAFFGELNFDEQVQLLHKHAVHHLKQFGLL